VNPSEIFKSLYPEKFEELAAIIEKYAGGVSTEAVDWAAGEFLIGLSQCKSDADGVMLTVRIFSALIGKPLSIEQTASLGEEVCRWRRGFTDVNWSEDKTD